MKTNFQDSGTSEIRSTQIDGLQEAVGKLEDSIGMETTAEVGIALSEVYISAEDRYRIYQAPAGKRNWVASPTPVIKKNGIEIAEGFTIDYAGGAIIVSPSAISIDVFTADVTYVAAMATSFKTHLADIAKVYKLATELGMIDDDQTKATENYALLDAYINSGSDKKVFLNGGRFWLSQKLVITQPDTLIVGNNYGRNTRRCCLVADHADTVLEIDVPSGENGTFVEGIAVDGNSTAVLGIDIKDNTFDRNRVRDVFINNIAGTAVKLGKGCYSFKFNNIFTGANVEVGLEAGSANNGHITFEDCQFVSTQYSVILGSDTPADSALLDARFIGCDLTSDGVPLLIRKATSCSFKDTWIEINSDTPSSPEALIVLGTANVACTIIDFNDCYCHTNGKAPSIFKFVNCDMMQIGDGCKFGGYTHLINAVGKINTNYPTNKFTSGEVNPTMAINGATIAALFSVWHGESSMATQYQWKTRFDYDPDFSGNGAGNDIIIKSKRRTEAHDRIRVTESGLYIGAGTSAFDVGYSRYGANIGGMATGDSFQLDGTWNGGHFIMGTYHLWVSATGKLYIKNGVPANDTDGTVVGAQT